MLKLSIIVPYHNNKEKLLRLLNSIPENNLLEVVIVDDHSDVALSNVEHSCVKIIQQTKGRRWAGAARNTGMAHSTGSYLLFADNDDYFVDGAFDIIFQYLGDDDVVFFKPTSINDDGSISNRHFLYQDLVDEYIKNNDQGIRYKFHVPWSKLFRRDFLLAESILFDEVIASNDVLFSLKSSLLCKKFSVVNKCIYCVVESSASLTKKKSEQIIDSRFDALSRYNDFLISRNDKNLAAMSGHLKNAMSFGFSKFMYRYFYCINKGYPIFYNLSHVFRAFRYIRARNKG